MLSLFHIDIHWQYEIIPIKAAASLFLDKLILIYGSKEILFIIIGVVFL